MVGIERIKIKSESDWLGNYQKVNRDCEPMANKLYIKLFTALGMPLAGEEIQETLCEKEDAIGRYDWKEGIDIILHFADGTKATMQEKYLTYHISTMTFETEKTSGKPGAWYYCTAQYYFIACAKNYTTGDTSFQDWMLINLAMLHSIDMKTVLPWKNNKNKNNGRRASFKYLEFNDVPKDCIVARKRVI
jgi:hypothetical protein